MKEDLIETLNIKISSLENEKKSIQEALKTELDDLIQQMAVSLIKENEPVIGKDIADKAKERLEKEKTQEEGGKEDEKKTRTRRKSTKSI